MLPSTSLQLIDWMGDDYSVVRAARVSYAKEGKGDELDKKLLRYLLVNEHTSPFEHVMFTFRVECPIFVARQWMRHRTWSFNEVSYRYTEAPNAVWNPDQGWRTQGTGNKQMSAGPLGVADRLIAEEIYIEATEAAFNYYQDLLEQGVVREQARAVLPVATMTSFYASVDLHNLLHFLRLRLHVHAQPEIQVYAQRILELITPLVPWTVEIWKELNDNA